VLSDASSVSSFVYDPRDPCPSIGGNLFGYRDVLLAGAFNQMERAGHFLCQEPYLPLSSRPDVLVFRTEVLTEPLDVTGSVVVHLLISSDAPDTDFTAKLVDEYPPNASYPSGYAMNITHGIVRCRFRNSRTDPQRLEPGRVEQVSIELYPISNLFAAGHRLRLDISSSNFPHFDTNPNTGRFDDFECGATQRALNSVWHSEVFPSRIVLPVQTKSPTRNSNGVLTEV
jgi:putative CocE/NonD family hydrolase